jgi:glycosyltransferase involved in cell wall biosynthesis
MEGAGGTMVILFLTSSLEPGRDGVGDYTRRLTQACLRLGHSCCLMALNDPHVSAPVETAEPAGGDRLIPTLRLPATMPWPERLKRAVEFRSRFQPDRISLQFVAYGFDRKGIVRNLDRHLAPITSGIALHIMFHELWIGLGKSSPLKDRVVGQVQRHFMQRLLGRLQPGWVSTSNALYVSLLESLGQSAMELPLFGNIPINDAADAPAIPEVLVREGICDQHGSHPGRRLGLFFGTLHPEWKPEPFMSSLIAASAKAGTRACLISAGRLGGRGDVTWKKMEHDYAHAVDFIRLGEQPVRQVSALMLAADFGVAASPWPLIGKSGSAAAMLDHGLPVIVSRDDFQAAVATAPPEDPLLHRCDPALESKLVASLPKRPARDRVNDVAREFIRLLTSSPRQGPLE